MLAVADGRTRRFFDETFTAEDILENREQKMLEFYATYDESGRLTRTGHGRLELLRTRDLLGQHLPAAPAAILDVGGGTGIHAAWLAQEGYAVHLIDPVPQHVDSARAKFGLTADLGDARDLNVPDRSVDAVLLLGPLYHLVDSSDRNRAVSEAHRVLRPGGMVIAAGISRYMALLGYCAVGELDLAALNSLLPSIQGGRHSSEIDFTEAYLHTPEELAGEVRAGGFVDVKVFGVEGPAWIALDAAGDVSDSLLEGALLCARALEDDASVLSVSAHFLAIGTRSVD